jgi:hypothetical protein
LGGGNVRVASGATLKLNLGVTNGYISDAASLLLNGSAAVNLAFTGTDTIGDLSFDGGVTWQAAGTWGAIGSTATHQNSRFTGTGTLTVNPADTAITVASPLNPAGFKTALSFTATNLPADATGDVVFLANGTAFSTNSLAGGGASSLALLTLPRGTNTITAQYAGDSNYFGSTNTLAGGQIITNHPPFAGTYAYTSSLSVISFLLPVGNLTNTCSDTDGYTLTVASLGLSTNGITPVLSSGLFQYYSTNKVSDQFHFVVTDGFGGSATGSVNVVFYPFPVLVGQNGTFSVSGGKAKLKFIGISGYPYAIDRSTNLLDWIQIMSTNAPANGAFQYEDDFSDLGTPPSSAYYRLKYNP